MGIDVPKFFDAFTIMDIAVMKFDPTLYTQCHTREH